MCVVCVWARKVHMNVYIGEEKKGKREQNNGILKEKGLKLCDADQRGLQRCISEITRITYMHISKTKPCIIRDQNRYTYLNLTITYLTIYLPLILFPLMIGLV